MTPVARYWKIIACLLVAQSFHHINTKSVHLRIRGIVEHDRMLNNRSEYCP